LKVLVDTNVVSQTRKDKPNPAVAGWWQLHPVSDLALSAISIQEIRLGTELLPAGKRRDAIEIWLEDFVLKQFAGRILPVDAAIADMSARMAAAARKKGHTADLADALIAATARVHSLKLATLNTTHFEPLGVDLVTW
jgi:toxin FitB